MMKKLNLQKGDKVAFKYYNPETNKTIKHHGEIRKRIRETEDSYIVFFKEEKGFLIGDPSKKISKVVYHNYLLNEDSFIKKIDYDE